MTRTAITHWVAIVALATLATPSIGMDEYVMVYVCHNRHAHLKTYTETLILMTTIIIDINECILEIDTCHHVCKNTVGSYICTCGEGYRMADNGTCLGNATISIPYSLLSWLYLWYD